jgi:D-alanyl-D-alanine carboxypeptidase/D-alanyl-D-alanine-endopeptidase (penicillin-binding protein 4)
MKWRMASALLLAPVTLAFSLPRPSPGGESELDRLESELASLLHTYRWRTAEWSVLVVSLDRGDTIFAMDPDVPRAPASNMKLLTTAAALRELGPEYRFRTFLVTDGSIEDGVLRGDLVVFGSGDPGISDRFYPSTTAVFEELADQLLERGIHAVDGDLVGDASLLPGPLRPPGWDAHDLNDHFAPGISALSFNENVVTLRVEGGPTLGSRPIVHSLPDHGDLDIVNQATTVTEPARLFIGRDEPTAPIVLSGGIQLGGRDVWRQITVGDPAAFSVSVFRAVLEERGIAVRGASRVEDRPSASAVRGRRVTAPTVSGRPRARVLATHVSPPLREYLAVINKKSNNFFAELVFRTLGRVSRGEGSLEAATAAVAHSLDALGVDTAGVVQLDGSGLSPANRVRAGTFVSLLSRVAEGPLWGEFWATLPEAGNRRELARMYRTPAAGNLRAKTGTIEGVSALSGVVQSSDGERLAFSILVNGAPSTARAKRVENGIGARLASFTRGADALADLPAMQLPPPPIPADSGGPTMHHVTRGESMDGIARRYGVSLDDLLEANPSVEPRRLQAGSWIRIPPAREGSGSSAGGAR